ncbi:MAG: YlxR family protein [Acidobacteriota bacterium]|nr:YlxR family protein [Acidobacteriota bacterium]
MAPHTPLRRCAGCAAVRPTDRLLRLALSPDRRSPVARVVIDRDRSLRGRGAYLCLDPLGGGPSTACLREALRRGGIARTLRSRAPVSRELVESTDGG